MISNPPYNIKWKRSDCPFSDRALLVPEGNANYAFVLRALEFWNDSDSETDTDTQRACFILPLGSLTGSTEREARKLLVDEGYLSAVLLLPEKMFESTSIPVCILFLEKHNKYRSTIFMDLTRQTVPEVRLQAGQYGGAAHTNRIYRKTFESLSPDKITEIVRIINERQGLPKWAVTATHDAIALKDYCLAPRLYVPQEGEDKRPRPLEYIVDDLNRVCELRNVLRLVINEKKAKELGLYETALLHEKSRKYSESLQELTEKLTGKRLVLPDYIQLSKKGGEITLQNNHPKLVSVWMQYFLHLWSQYIRQLNDEENVFLKEMRDALIEKLMSGEIDVSELKTPEDIDD